MKEQPLDEQREREEGRPDPEELLRRYGLRDSDMGVPALNCSCNEGSVDPAGRRIPAPAWTFARLSRCGGRSR